VAITLQNYLVNTEMVVIDLGLELEMAMLLNGMTQDGYGIQAILIPLNM